MLLLHNLASSSSEHTYRANSSAQWYFFPSALSTNGRFKEPDVKLLSLLTCQLSCFCLYSCASMFAIVTPFAACWLAAIMLPTIVAIGACTWVGDGTLGTAAPLWENVVRVLVGPIVGAASIVISVVVVAPATVAAVALITSISTEGVIGEGGVALEAATVTGVVSSRFVNLVSLVAAISVPGVVPGRVVTFCMPSARVAVAGINVAATFGEYVAPAVVSIVGPANACHN